MNIEKLSAYEIISDRRIRDVDSRGLILRHKKSGARIACLSNQDDNKVFYIAFRTPPKDETGVPHIIEHTTLCGSDKYPVKDPFIELAKGSLNTFLNAITYPDKTIYPIASCNDQDFRNLMDVYLDAVFHPNITRYEEIFRQEGWHYELEDKEKPITINGVVYNEMKGAYSSPEDLLQSKILASLFPDNTYSRDSGGHPDHIPELTYQAYLDFYHQYYHPSNSYIYLYGDMDLEERLEYLDREYLSHYDYRYVDSVIEDQKPFERPAELSVEYSIASDDTEENAAYLSWNRVVGPSLDPMLYQAFQILDYALVDAPGAPVKKALTDAGIGEDVYGNFDSGIKQMVFSIVAQNAEESDQADFQAIICQVLEQQVREGIDRDTLLAAINSLEFRCRESDFGRFPKGLLYGLDCMETWLFDDEKAFQSLERFDIYAQLREKIGTGYFEQLVLERLLNNPHGSLVVAAPRRGKNAEEEEALARKLAAYKDSLSEEEVQKLVEETAALRRYQEEASPEEDLEKIPMLSREDIRKEAVEFSNTIEEIGGRRVLLHDIPSNGIDYVNLIFDAEDTAPEEVGYLGLLAACLGYVDTASYSYRSLSNEINIYTGGISSGASLYSGVDDSGKLILKYQVTFKVMAEHVDRAARLAAEIMFTSKLDDTERLKEIISQLKSRLQVSLSSGGDRVASVRGLAGFSRNYWYQDALSGIEFYRTVCRAEQMLTKKPQLLTEKLTGLCSRLFAGNRLMISFTGNRQLYAEALPALKDLVDRMPACSPVGSVEMPLLKALNEGYTDASQIQYVASCGNFAEKGYRYTGQLRLLKQILGLDYLWNNVRVKGGAYGVFASFQRNGDSYFASYRDPHLKRTLDAYKGVPAYLREFSADERDMTKYIIGTFGEMDIPMNPEAKGSRSLRAYLEGITYEQVQKERDEILNATAEDIRGLADLVEAVLDEDRICVVGNETKIRSQEMLFDSIQKLCN